MNRCTTVLVVALLAASQGPLQAQQPSGQEHAALRADIEKQFDVVPLTDGVALRPKSRTGDVRLVEVTDGTILVNGTPVTGAELRERLGTGADAVLRLSYMTSEARRAAFAEQPGEAPPEVQPVDPLPPLEAPAGVPAPPPPPDPPGGASSRGRHSSGDRVRVFGDVSVAADERVSGQAVAVLGSVRIDGEVGDQVVSVLGSVDLGPNAVVRGDVVSVGGRVRRAEGAQVRGSVTEIAFANPNMHWNIHPGMDWRALGWFDGFGALPRLIGTTFRVLLLVLLACIALLVARPTVEASAQRVADNPVQATLVGIAAQILLIPALVMTAIVLSISIIGIPLLLLLPFVVLLIILLALAGFSGTVYAVGQWARRRFSLGSTAPFAEVLIGVLIVLSPILIARLIALGGWPLTPLVVALLIVGFMVELVAWSSGFGAVLTNAFSRWQARRAGRTIVPPPAYP